jgi:hypothetical protein
MCLRREERGGKQCPGCLECNPPKFTEDAIRELPESLFDSQSTTHDPLVMMQTRLGEREGYRVFQAVQRLYYLHEHDLTGVPSIARRAFLIASLRYDPPDESLLEFADCALEWLALRTPIDEHQHLFDPRDDAQGLPIEWMPYLPDYKLAIEKRQNVQSQLWLTAFENAIAMELEALGIDPVPVIAQAEERQPGIFGELAREQCLEWAKSPDDSPSGFLKWVWQRAVPHIRVDDFTSANDVRDSFSVINTLRDRSGAMSKPLRDELTCLQCAILRDRLNWTHEQIGQRYGWQVQYPPKQIPRCETARQHVAQGRQLLRTVTIS